MLIIYARACLVGRLESMLRPSRQDMSHVPSYTVHARCTPVAQPFLLQWEGITSIPVCYRLHRWFPVSLSVSLCSYEGVVALMHLFVSHVRFVEICRFQFLSSVSFHCRYEGEVAVVRQLVERVVLDLVTGTRSSSDVKRALLAHTVGGWA